jgi:hypothetical protein
MNLHLILIIIAIICIGGVLFFIFHHHHRHCDDNKREEELRIVFVNFATKSHAHLQEKQNKWLDEWIPEKHKKYTKIMSYNEDTLCDLFYTEHEDLKNDKRGFMYWSWKPWVILNAMLKNTKDSAIDFIVYCDSSSKFIISFEEFCKTLENNKKLITTFQLPDHLIEKHWNKKYCFQTLFDFVDDFDSGENVLNSPQICATASIYNVKHIFNRIICMSFLSDWNQFCKQRKMICDDSKKEDEDKSFIEHRHDQSVFSLLCKTKYKNHVNKIPIYDVLGHHHLG